MIKKGVYAASLSVFNDDFSLDIKATLDHDSLIKMAYMEFSFLVLLDKVINFIV